MNEYEVYMRRAIKLAANVPDFPFGALIVDRGRRSERAIAGAGILKRMTQRLRQPL